MDDLTLAYIRETFAVQGRHQATLMDRAAALGIPDIAVSPETGKLLQIFTSMVGEGRGARVAVEIGTLAGYSAIWIARALHHEGRLIAIEPNSDHAAFAERAFDEAGLASRIEVRRQTGLEALPRLLTEFGPGGVDLIFLDAIKEEYLDYFEAAHPLLAAGGVLLADNALGTRSVRLTDPPGSHPERDALVAFNHRVSRHPDYESMLLPVGTGLLVARKRSRPLRSRKPQQ